MSRKRWVTATAVAVTALGVGAIVPLAGVAKGTSSHATLTGKAERPKHGEPKGSGTGTITINGTQVCFKLSWTAIGAPVAGHIHKGGASVAGPVVVPLFGTTAKRSGCVKAKAAIAKDIAAHPAKYYVNLHSKKFPNGAIRGQLK